MASISSSEESDGQETIKRHYSRRNGREQARWGCRHFASPDCLRSGRTYTSASSSSSRTSQLPTITRGTKRPTIESSQGRRSKDRAYLNALLGSGDEDTLPSNAERAEGNGNVSQSQNFSYDARHFALDVI